MDSFLLCVEEGAVLTAGHNDPLFLLFFIDLKKKKRYGQRGSFSY